MSGSKKTTFWCVFFVCSSILGFDNHAFGQYESFQKEYETKAFTHCYDIVSTSDGGYLMSGIEDVPTNPASSTVPYILKLDCNGEPEWKRKYAHTSTLNNLNHKVAAVDDSNYVLLTSDGVTGNFDLLITSVDIDGNTNWIYRYGGTGPDLPGNIITLSDGNLAVTGATRSYGNNVFSSAYYDLYVLKINASNGNIIWSKTFGISGANARGYDLVENELGGVTVVGTAFDANSIATWAPMISLDINGNLYDERYFGLPNRNTMALSISRAKDGGFIISGSTNFLGNDWFDLRQFPFVIKTNQSKQIEWGRIIEGFPNTTGLGGIAYTPVDNGDTIGVAIETYYYQNVTSDPTKRVLTLLQETNGALISARQYNSEGGQFPAMDYDIDGGYIMSAMTDENIGSGPNDQWWYGPIINKLDKHFNSGCNETNRTQVTTAHNVNFTVDTNFSLSDSFGAVQFPITPGSDSVVFSYPVVETFCEAKHQVTGALLTNEIPCGDTSSVFEVAISYPIFDLTWDFGDGTVVHTGNVDTVRHGYQSPGVYPLSVNVDLCDTSFVLQDTIVVLSELPDTVIVPPYSFCQYDSSAILNAIVPNGTWSGNGIINNSTGFFSPTIAGVGAHEIVYEISSGACQGSDTATITVKPLPIVRLGADTVICSDDSLSIGLPDTLDSYQWNTGESQNRIYATPGQYWLEATLSGCVNADTILIEGAVRPVFTLGADTAICEGETVTLDPVVTGSGDYRWSDGSSDSTLTLSTSGNYGLVITNRGCEAQDEITVTVNANPEVSLGPDTTICADETLILNASTPGAIYEWQDGSSEAFLEAMAGAIYSVTVSVNDCTGDADIFIDELDCSEGEIELPNVFSPNGDGYNDVLTPTKLRAISQVQTKILNRWGQQVFESNELEINWDGTKDGQLVPDGVYYVLLTYVDFQGARGTVQASVTLISNP
jgi:gliding motility-associated-like protein